MCVFLISPVPITKPLTSELIDTPVFYNLAPRPIKYRVSVPIPRGGGVVRLTAKPRYLLLLHRGNKKSNTVTALGPHTAWNDGT